MSLEPRGAERNPAENHEQQRERPRDARRQAEAVAHRRAIELVHGERAAVQCAPQHEVPVRPVPQSAQEHRQHEVDVGAPGALPVPAERDVQIVPQPGAERDVPAAPELGHASGDVRHVEILWQVVADHLGRTDGHVGIAREVAVNLQAVADHRQPQHASGIKRGLRKDLVNRRGQPVGDDHFLRQPEQKETGARGQSIGGRSDPPRHLRKKDRRADDRAGDELREKRDERGVVHQRPARLDLAPVHVDRVAHRLEGVEADAGGKKNLQRRKAEPAPRQDVVQIPDEEVVILEVGQNGEVRRDAERHPATARRRPVGGRNPRRAVVVDDADEQQQRQISVVPRGVERARRDQQDALLELVAEGNRQEPQDDEEEHEETGARKNHGRRRIP